MEFEIRRRFSTSPGREFFVVDIGLRLMVFWRDWSCGNVRSYAFWAFGVSWWITVTESYLLNLKKR